MNTPRLFARPSAILLMAVGLLAAGLLVEVALIAPRMRELTRLAQQRTELLGQLAEAHGRERQAAQIARLLGAGSLEAAYAAYPRGDALSLTAEAIAQARLERVELLAREKRLEGALQCTDLVVRVRGPYARILQWVGSLERGPALVRIGSVVINPHPDSQLLDAVLSLSVYTLAAES